MEVKAIGGCIDNRLKSDLGAFVMNDDNSVKLRGYLYGRSVMTEEQVSNSTEKLFLTWPSGPELKEEPYEFSFEMDVLDVRVLNSAEPEKYLWFTAYFVPACSLAELKEKYGGVWDPRPYLPGYSTAYASKDDYRIGSYTKSFELDGACWPADFPPLPSYNTYSVKGYTLAGLYNQPNSFTNKWPGNSNLNHIPLEEVFPSNFEYAQDNLKEFFLSLPVTVHAVTDCKGEKLGKHGFTLEKESLIRTAQGPQFVPKMASPAFYLQILVKMDEGFLTFSDMVGTSWFVNSYWWSL